MNTLTKTLALVLMSTTVLFSQEGSVSTSKFGKGIFNIMGKDSTWSMNFSARMQFLATSEWQATQDKWINPTQDFLVRRSRLKFDGFAYDKSLTYKIELGLSNRDMSGTSVYTSNTPRYIMDAVIMWNFYENFSLWVGQTKLPGNIERVVSSGNLQLVDRSKLNSEFNIDRDMGMQLRHHFTFGNKFIVREKLAVSQGEGRNITTGNLGGHEYTARLELLPFGAFEGKGDYSGGDLKREKTLKMMLSGTYDFNNDAVKTKGNQGSYMTNDKGFFETDITTYFLDAMIKYKGFSFMGEYASRKADDPYAKNSDGTLTGKVVNVGKSYNLQAGYLFKNNYEIAGRLTSVEFDKEINNKGIDKQYTLGLSKYIVGHKLKVQTDFSYLSSETSSDEVMWRLQFDIHF